MRSAGLLLLGIMSASCAARTDASVQQRYRAELDEGRWAEAYVLSGELLCDAESLELARELVQLWDRVGRPGEPQQNVDCTLGDTTTRYMDALAAAVREDYDRSATLLRAAAKSASRPQKAELRFREGVVLAMGNRPSDAVAALEGASVADPRRVDVRLALASARLDALGPEPAIETLKGILSLTPSSRELKRAREILNRAVRAGEPKMEPALAVEISNLLGAIEKDQVSSETALRLRERTGEGAHPKLLMVSGLVLMKLGRLAEGSHALVAAASANPLDAAALRSLGTTLFAAGQVEMALPHLREAARRDPFDADTLKTLAEGSAAVGDVQTAAVAYEKLVVLEPRNPEHYLWIARMERRRGDLPSARRAALRGCELVTSSIPLYLERASIEAQIALSTDDPAQRRQASARTRDAVDALLEIAPGHPGARPILESLEAID